jgi:hypothetical protein
MAQVNGGRTRDDRLVSDHRRGYTRTRWGFHHFLEEGCIRMPDATLSCCARSNASGLTAPRSIVKIACVRSHLGGQTPVWRAWDVMFTIFDLLRVVVPLLGLLLGGRRIQARRRGNDFRWPTWRSGRALSRIPPDIVYDSRNAPKTGSL